MDKKIKIIAKATTDYTIDGKVITSYQVVLHTDRGLKVCKIVKDMYASLRLNMPCNVFYDEYGRIANITY